MGMTATIAKIEPMLGIKFRKNVTDANKSATSTLEVNKMMNVMSAVKIDVKNFVAIYRVIFDSTSSSIICRAVFDFSPIAINNKKINTSTMLLMIETMLPER